MPRKIRAYITLDINIHCILRSLQLVYRSWKCIISSFVSYVEIIVKLFYRIAYPPFYLVNIRSSPLDRTWVPSSTAECSRARRPGYGSHSAAAPSSVDQWRRARLGSTRCVPSRSRRNVRGTCDRNEPSASVWPHWKHTLLGMSPCRRTHHRKLWKQLHRTLQ